MKTLKYLTLAAALLLPAAALSAQTVQQKTAKPAAKKAQTAPAKPAAKKAQTAPAKPAAKPATAPAATGAQTQVSTAPAPAAKAAEKPALPPFEEAVGRLASADAVQRRMGAEALARLRDPKAVPHLMKHLSDQDPSVRSAAVDALCQLTAREATPRISDMMLKDADPAVRQQAAGSLAFMMDQSAGPALLKAMKDKDPAVRYSAANTLGAMHYAPAEKQMLEAISDEKMRRIAINVLGLLQSKAAVPAIAPYLADPDKFTRLEAIKAIGVIGDASYNGEMKKLLDAGEDPAVRVEAAMALAKQGEADGMMTAYEFAKSPDLSLKSKSLEIFYMVGDERAKKYLEDAVSTEKDQASKSMYDFALRRLSARLKAKAGN